MKKLLIVLGAATLLAGCHTGNDRSKGGSDMDSTSQSSDRETSNISTNSSSSESTPNSNTQNPNQ